MPVDLTYFAATLGDPSLYFIDDANRAAALVVEHATGDPVYVIVGDALYPYETWRNENQRPATPKPPAQGISLLAQPGKFQLGATVTNPGE